MSGIEETPVSLLGNSRLYNCSKLIMSMLLDTQQAVLFVSGNLILN